MKLGILNSLDFHDSRYRLSPDQHWAGNKSSVLTVRYQRMRGMDTDVYYEFGKSFTGLTRGYVT
jgi:hypothetical protein